MGSVGFPLKSLACILIVMIPEGFCDSHNETWCYDKPSCGPQTWGSLGFCNGRKQSPINIDTKDAIPWAGLGPIKFTNYEDRKLVKQLKNKGPQAVVKVHSGATISSNGLRTTYYLQDFHFHWGTEDSDGSEHTINGQRYSMELHLVHTKNNMSIEEALKDPEGVAVLALFMKKSRKYAQANPWNTLANLFKKIPEKGDTWDLNGEFSVGGLLSMADVSHYYSYKGSLTTPDCEEVVTWIIFPDPIEVSERVGYPYQKTSKMDLKLQILMVVVAVKC
ncbi:putative carbonic anhydrase 5 [Liasis olivaceus]